MIGEAGKSEICRAGQQVETLDAWRQNPSLPVCVCVCVCVGAGGKDSFFC